MRAAPGRRCAAGVVNPRRTEGIARLRDILAGGMV
jgi:hypothetical protein